MSAGLGAPDFGVGRTGLPRFVPKICSDFPVFFRFVLLVFGNTPICSDLLRFLQFVPICFQNRSGKPLSADPFCKSPTGGKLSELQRRPSRGPSQSLAANFLLLAAYCCWAFLLAVAGFPCPAILLKTGEKVKSIAFWGS